MNNQFTCSHLPISNANNTSILYPVNTVQVELVKEELEYQNHQLQKNLLHVLYSVKRWS